MDFKKLRVYVILIQLLLGQALTSCKKFLEVNAPNTSINSENVYNTDATAAAVLTGLYTKLSAGSFTTGLNSVSILTGLSSDELVLYNKSSNISLTSYYTNSLTSNSGNSLWNPLYETIYTSNSALEGLNQSKGLSSTVRQQLIGEAKFIRAFCYFYLLNLYGDVPLILTTDYQLNANSPRTSSNKVWENIISDLVDAKNMLNMNYLDGSVTNASVDRVRPNKGAATALLARCYLFTNQWEKAENEASSLITNVQMYHLENSLNDVFLKNSSEAIWQLQPIFGGWNTEDARVLVLPPTGPNGFEYPIYLNNYLLNSIEKNDERRSAWIDSIKIDNKIFFFANKYKKGIYGQDITEYLMILRLAEQYLIRSEARAQQSNLDDALADLNIIRSRAALPSLNSLTKNELLKAINHERQIELFTEWGHRWIDMKRVRSINEIMTTVTPQKGGIWNTNWEFFPIPLSDILSNPKLKQNDGY